MSYVKPKQRDGKYAQWKKKHTDSKSMSNFKPGGSIDHYKSTVQGKRGMVDKYSMKLGGVGLGSHIIFGSNKEGETFRVTHKPSSFDDNERFTTYGKFDNPTEGDNAFSLSNMVMDHIEGIETVTLPPKKNPMFKQNEEGDTVGAFAWNVDDLLIPKEPAKMRAEAARMPALEAEFRAKEEAVRKGEGTFSQELQKHLDYVERFYREYEEQGTLRRVPDTPIPRRFEVFPYESCVKKFAGYVCDEDGIPMLKERTVGGQTFYTAEEVREDAFFSDIQVGTLARVWTHMGALYTTESWGCTLWGTYFLIVDQDESAAAETTVEGMDPELLAMAKAMLEKRKAAEAASGATAAKAAVEAARAEAARSQAAADAAGAVLDGTAGSAVTGGEMETEDVVADAANAPMEGGSEETSTAPAETLPEGLAEDAAAEGDGSSRRRRRRREEGEEGDSRKRRRRRSTEEEE